MATSNNQTYFVITESLLSFMNAPTFKYKSPADIGRAAKIEAARTTAKILNGVQVRMSTAKKVWSMCSIEGYSHSFEVAFNKVN